MNTAASVGALKARWGVIIHNKQLGIAWILAAMLGAFVISASPELDVKRFFLPVLVMFFYVILAFNRAHIVFKQTGASSAYQHALVSQMADSVYFLGFLWTLWALIDSFVLKTGTTSASVFRTFGYALVTTSCGTFLRLAILQFRFSAFDQSSEAEVSIEEKLQHFGAVLSATESHLDAWTVRLAQSSKGLEAIEAEIRTALRNITEESRGTLTAVLAQHKGLVDVTVKESCAGIEKTAQALSVRMSSAISDTLSPLKAEVLGVSDAFKKANISLRKSVPGFTERMDAASAEFERNQVSLSALSESAIKACGSMGNLQVSINGLAREADSAGLARIEFLDLVKNTMNGVGEGASGAIKEAIANIDWRQAFTINLDNSIVLEELRRGVTAIKLFDAASASRLDVCVKELQSIRAAADATKGASEPVEIANKEVMQLLREIRESLSTRRKSFLPW